MAKWQGKNLSVEIYGESHGEKVGAICHGFPEIKIDNQKLESFLSRRKASSGVFSTTRIEPDNPVFSEISNGCVKGDFSVDIFNTNKKSKDYNELFARPRPSHADYCSYVKDGTLDFSGGGRFSARLTAPLCAVGGIAIQYLEKLGIRVHAYLSEVGSVKAKSYKSGAIDESELLSMREDKIPSLSKKDEIIDEISKAKADFDSVGGRVECIVYGLKAGYGNNLFEGLEGKIASLVYAIPAVKGVEFGDGFDLCKMKGSIANDSLRIKDGVIYTETNKAGGINGGISNGEQITLSVAFRPTPSIFKEQKTVDLEKKKNVTIQIKGRHDSCVAVRAVPCVESAVALAILDEIL